jgi:hypothetical protein
VPLARGADRVSIDEEIEHVKGVEGVKDVELLGDWKDPDL